MFRAFMIFGSRLKNTVEVVKAHKLSREWHLLQPGAINSRV